MKRSFYEMLEVSRKATREQIDEAYARMTKKLGAIESARGNAESLSQLNIIREGYNILSDPEKRTMYDAKLYATEAGITLMFFPKDAKAVKKLGIDTVIFATLACIFTYVIYQKMTHEVSPVRVEPVKAEKAIANALPTGASPVEPAMAASTAELPANAPDSKGLAKADLK
jgi:hypothetical protein